MVRLSLKFNTETKTHTWALLDDAKRPGWLDIETAQGCVTLKNCPCDGDYQRLEGLLTKEEKETVPLICLYFWCVNSGRLILSPLPHNLRTIILPLSIATRAILEDIEYDIINHVTKEAPELTIAIATHVAERASVEKEIESCIP
jgi:hypothetical protein